MNEIEHYFELADNTIGILTSRMICSALELEHNPDNYKIISSMMLIMVDVSKGMPIEQRLEMIFDLGRTYQKYIQEVSN